MIGVTLSEIQHIVEVNDKQRFLLRWEDDIQNDTLSETAREDCQQNKSNRNGNQSGSWWIKANQGHSMDILDLELTPILIPSEIPVLIHGTYSSCIESIEKNGLSRMKRNHIHLATGKFGEKDVISGMRQNCDVLIYIDAEKAMRDGLKFYRSPNNVILCPGNSDGFLLPKYFDQIEKICE